MTYGEFKTLMTTINRAGSVLATGIDTIVHKAICDVALEAKPLHLVTENVAYEPLLLLVDPAFLRMPSKPIQDEDLIDIDDDLVTAVAYKTWEIIEINRDNKLYFKKMCMDDINSYLWRIYESAINRPTE